jgi:hypothetical protein
MVRLIWRCTNNSGSQYGFNMLFSSNIFSGKLDGEGEGDGEVDGACDGGAIGLDKTIALFPLITSFIFSDTLAPRTGLFLARGRIIFVGRFIVGDAIAEAIMNDDNYMISRIIFISVSILFLFKYNHNQLWNIVRLHHPLSHQQSATAYRIQILNHFSQMRHIHLYLHVDLLAVN